MNGIKKLNVYYHDRLVGTLAELKTKETAFEYDDTWLTDGFPISPFSLPLKKEVFIAKMDPFDGLFGVFADSLPDGWGRLLVDRLLLKNHIDPFTVNNLTRLAIVGSSGMGALTYKPVIELHRDQIVADFDRLAIECKKLLQTDTSDDLDELFQLGGSSGGARPKILTQVDNDEWIIKFPSSSDINDIGELEYHYALCAGKCGIEIPQVRLFPSKICKGYFGVKRFDRVRATDGNTQRVHMLTVSAILETSHRIPNLDYDILMRLTRTLTSDDNELIKLYRLMCFNVFAHNQDDHSKNFTYIYDEAKDRWHLSPAYDLTYSYSFGGEHATCVNGNGNPNSKDLLMVAANAGIPALQAEHMMLAIKNTVRKDLGKYLS